MFETTRFSDRNVLLTGIPRSGTTLLNAFLDCPPKSVAIGEPLGLGVFQREYANNHHGFVNKINEYFSHIRVRIANGEPFKDRVSVDGNPLTNYVESGGGIRKKSYEIRDRVIKNVERDFYLFFKAPVIFTSVLPAIVSDGRFKVIAIIRDPVSTILSWNSVNFPIAKGRLPAGEEYWPLLGSIARNKCSTFEKQAQIWEIFAQRYVQYKDIITLLRYEDLVTNPMSLFEMLCLPFTNIHVKNSNNNPVYDFENIPAIKNALHKYSPMSKLLYP